MYLFYGGSGVGTWLPHEVECNRDTSKPECKRIIDVKCKRPVENFGQRKHSVALLLFSNRLVSLSSIFICIILFCLTYEQIIRCMHIIFEIYVKIWNNYRQSDILFYMCILIFIRHIEIL